MYVAQHIVTVNTMGRSVHLLLWSIWRESWVTPSQLPRRPSNYTTCACEKRMQNACNKGSIGSKLLSVLQFKMIHISEDKRLRTQNTILSLTVQLKSPWFPLLVADPKEKAKSHPRGRELKHICSFWNWFCILSESPNWCAALRRSQHHDGHRSWNIHLKGNASFALCCGSSDQGVKIFPLFFQFFLF